jgi:hypothetical protein
MVAGFLLIDQDRFDEALDIVQVALEHRPGDENLIEMHDWLEDELEPGRLSMDL